MITATYQKYNLNFKAPSGTSRGVLQTKETWFLYINISFIVQKNQQSVQTSHFFLETPCMYFKHTFYTTIQNDEVK